MTTVFSKMGRRRTGISLSSRFSTSTFQTDGLAALDKMTRCPASGPPEITGPDRLWLFPLGVREGQSLCTSTARNRGWAAGTHHCSCQVGHARYAAERLVRASLSHRCLPSNKRGGGTLSVCDTTWNCTSLCNCSHQFCKNIPVSFDLITTWNSGVCLC